MVIYIFSIINHISTISVKVDDGEPDDEFEERFLQCFGLGDPEQQPAAKKPVTRTPSQPDPTEREELLRRQAKNSPWSVQLCGGVVILSIYI